MMIEGRFGFALGPERQLFADEMLVEEAENAERVLHQPEKHAANPVLAPTMPEERDMVCLHGTALFDPVDSLFKAWYRSGYDMRYAVSEDGLRWDKPVFDLFPDGGRPTNIVYRGPHSLDRYCAWSLDGFSVMPDAGPTTPETRFKAIMNGYPRPTDGVPDEEREALYGYYTATSPDGIHWAETPKAVLTIEDDPLMSDANTCMWDPLKGRFIAFTKRHHVSPRTTGDQGVIVRVRGLAFSDDFKTWTRPQTCLIPDDQDPRDTHFYNQCGWTTEGMYVGLLEAYYSDYRNPAMPLRRDIQLLTSRDGELWWRAGDRKAFIPLGPDDSWDSHMLDLNAAGPVAIDDKLLFFYGGRDYPHDKHPAFFPWDRQGHYAIGIATLRRDGYVSYTAGDKPGAVLTRPIRFKKGMKLFINADAQGGWIKVEVCRVNEDDAMPDRPRRGIKYRIEDPLPGYSEDDAIPLSDDATRIPVRWQDGDALPQGHDWISLRFVLKNASIYSFWAE